MQQSTYLATACPTKYKETIEETTVPVGCTKNNGKPSRCIHSPKDVTRAQIVKKTKRESEVWRGMTRRKLEETLETATEAYQLAWSTVIGALQEQIVELEQNCTLGKIVTAKNM